MQWIQEGQVEQVTKIVDKDQVGMMRAALEYLLPLHCAGGRGNADIVKVLLEHGHLHFGLGSYPILVVTFGHNSPYLIPFVVFKLNDVDSSQIPSSPAVLRCEYPGDPFLVHHHNKQKQQQQNQNQSLTRIDPTKQCSNRGNWSKK